MMMLNLLLDYKEVGQSLAYFEHKPLYTLLLALVLSAELRAPKSLDSYYFKIQKNYNLGNV